MAVKMRLTRMGDKKNPFYRIVVQDSRKARDGSYIDLVGTYEPLKNPAEVKLDKAKAKEWISKGVQPTDTVRSILVKEGILKVQKAPKKTQRDKNKEKVAIKVAAKAEKVAKDAAKAKAKEEAEAAKAAAQVATEAPVETPTEAPAEEAKSE